MFIFPESHVPPSMPLEGHHHRPVGSSLVPVAAHEVLSLSGLVLSCLTAFLVFLVFHLILFYFISFYQRLMPLIVLLLSNDVDFWLRRMFRYMYFASLHNQSKDNNILKNKNQPELPDNQTVW